MQGITSNIESCCFFGNKTSLDGKPHTYLKKTMKFSSEDVAIQSELARWMQTPAPRRLSASLRKHISKKSSSWSLVIFGFLFGSFGSVFCALFLPWQYLNELSLDRSNPDLLEGIVTKTEPTNMSLNGVKIWKNEVTFRENDEEIVSVGFTTGQDVNEGQHVKVRVHPNDLLIHCPQNMRMSQGSLGAAFVLIFPVVGYSLMLGPWFLRRKRLKLYENGTVADMRVMGIQATNMHVNNQTVYKVDVQYPNVPGTMKAKVLDVDDLVRLQDAHRDNRTIRVIYDPKKPKRFVIV